ncbi:MAG TPA: mechanosensitive ion channel family protein [Thermoplasmatales archaeon]|nr:mechanosensitive ion channel family protein [Thermoplasmatales archaeon]
MEIEGEILLLLRLFIAVLVTFLVLSLILSLLKKKLLIKAKTKKQKSNILLFINMVKYVFILIFLIVLAFSYSGSWAELGLVAGLLTAAAGLALSKPLSGIVAWLVMVTKRPFEIGDRIMIGDVKGDVKDITLTHILLDEVGGTIDGEERSGRTVIVPNSTLFEEKIINYTAHDDFILDEINTLVTYESNLREAESIIKDAVVGVMEPVWEKLPKDLVREPKIRLSFEESGVNIGVRYYTPAINRNKLSTEIIREIFDKITESKSVEIAYPHTEIVLKNNTKFLSR